MNNFYVYIYYDSIGIPLYVGKGCRDRDKDHLRACNRQDGTYWHNKLNQMIDLGQDFYYGRLFSDLEESEAFEWEKWFIELYGRKCNHNGTLYNLTGGGEGISGGKGGSKEIEVWGEVFSSISSLLQDSRCKVSRGIFAKGIKEGLSNEEAATTQRGLADYKPFEAWGLYFASMNDFFQSPHCKVERVEFYRRLKRGLSIEEAATIPYLSKPVEAWGDVFTSFKTLLQDPRCKVKLGVLNDRLHQGWAIEEAATIVYDTNKKPLVGWGRIYDSLNDLSQDSRCRVSYCVLRDRLNCGWSVEEAATRPLWAEGNLSKYKYDLTNSIV